MTENDSFAMPKLFKINKTLLTFSLCYDMLIMLGQLSAAPFPVPKFVI